MITRVLLVISVRSRRNFANSNSHVEVPLIYSTVGGSNRAFMRGNILHTLSLRTLLVRTLHYTSSKKGRKMDIDEVTER